MTLASILLREKPCKMLILLKDGSQQWYLSKLAKESGATYVHTTKTLSKFDKAGLVAFETKGRVKSVKLTEKGVLLANVLEDIVKKTEPPAAPAIPSVPAAEEKKTEDRAIV